MSFPHRVELPRDTKLGVDLAFEGALGLQAPLCLSGLDDGAAVKLAQLVTAESVIILRNTAKPVAPPFISGSVYDLSSGQQERTASVTPDLIARLATFLITGKDQVGVQRPSAPNLEAKDPIAVLEPAKVPPPAPQPIVDAKQPTFDVSQGVSAGRVTSFALLGVGAAGVLAGVLAWSSGEEGRARLVNITRADGRLPLASLPVGEEALRRMREADTTQAVSFTLIGGGAGAIVGGVLGVLLFPASTGHLAVTPTASGASMQVSGRF